MLPAVLAVEAAEKGIDILALTDHNSARNIPAFAEACSIVGITGVFGMEVTTIEEVHVLALFETAGEALDFGEFIESSLPDIRNLPRLFGNQLITNLQGTATRQLEICLYGATSISFEQLVRTVLSRNGLAIPAHIDRPVNSVTAHLGFLPDLPYSAVESISIPPVVDTGGNTVVQGSDAHCIGHIGRRRCFIESDQGGFAGLREAFVSGSVTYLGACSPLSRSF